MTRSQQMAQQARNYGDDAVAVGSWAKIGRSHYRRSTGEEVRKTDRGWQALGYIWPSRFAAMSHANYRNREASLSSGLPI